MGFVSLPPTWALYQAAKATNAVTTPSNKMVAFPNEEFALGHMEGVCWLCGSDTRHGFPRTKVIKPTFTDGACAKAPNSYIVCEACTFALSRMELRNYSMLVIGEQLSFPSRAQWRDILLAPPESPCLCIISVSGQKWLHFKAKLSQGGLPLLVQFETEPVYITACFAGLLRRVEALYCAGFTKAEIASGQYQGHKILSMGRARWEGLEEVVQKHRRSRLFDVAVFVAQKTEKEA